MTTSAETLEKLISEAESVYTSIGQGISCTRSALLERVNNLDWCSAHLVRDEIEALWDVLPLEAKLVAFIDATYAGESWGPDSIELDKRFT